MSFLASEFGYSLNRKSEWFVGWLRMSQVQALLTGFTRMKQKEVDAVNKSSSGGHRVEATADTMHMVPGVVIKKREKK